MNSQPLINNRYRITALLGKGAMGQVYRAADWQMKQEVALKVIARDLALDEEILERFQREGEALRQLRHRNIVAFVEMFDYHGHQVIVMEYVPGGNLHGLIQQAEIPLPRVREIALDLCDALICAHRLNIIHRDIKPKNILMTESGIPKLADFGVARLMETGTQLTHSGTMMGTPQYMSPEAWEGQALDAQADVWSLGVVLYEMLTGEVPFAGETTAAVMKKVLTAPLPDIKALRPDTPEALVEIVERALARDKAQRYPSVRKMSLDIDQCLLPQPTAPTVPLPVPADWTLPLAEEPLHPALAPSTDLPPSVPPVEPPASEPPTASPTETPAAVAEETPKPDVTAKRLQPWWESTLVLVGVGVLAVLCLLVAAGLGWRALTSNLQASPTAAPVVIITTPVAVAAPLSQTQAATVPPARPSAPPTAASSPAPRVPAGASAAAPTPLGPTVPPPPTAVPPKPTPLLGIGSTRVSDKDSMPQVYVPAGEFTMGATKADIDQAALECPVDCIKDEKPQHTVTLDAYWIDQTDVTNAMFAKFVQATAYKTQAEKDGWSWVLDLASQKGTQVTGADWQHPRGLASTISGLDNHPVVMVSWNDAKAYCAWAGRQLPTEAQWEKAARGTEGLKFPWGNGPADGTRLNLADKNLNIKTANKAIDDGYTFTSPVGQYPAGASPYGALDMAGNVWQWVADWYDANAYAGSPGPNPAGPAGGTSRVMRGGGWGNLARLARAANRGKLSPDQRSGDLGFRCIAH